MKKLFHLVFLLAVLLSFSSGLSAQKLQLGGKAGMTQETFSTVNAEFPANSRTYGYAGFSAAFISRNLRLGVEVEFRYLKSPEKSGAQAFRLPVTGFVNLDRNSRVRLHGGAYTGLWQKYPESPSLMEWGLTSGLDFRVPVNEHLIFTTDTRAGCSLNRANQFSGGLTMRPLSRRFFLAIGIGIAFRK